MVNLLETSRKLLLGTAVHDVNFLGAHALCTAGSVHGYVAAADDSDLLRVVDRGVGVFLVRLHQIDTGQVFVRGVNAVCVLARHADKGRQTGTGANEDSLVTVTEQLVDGLRTAYNEVQNKLNTEVLQRVDLLLHDSLRQTELRNAVHEYAAGGVQRLENGNFVTHTSQIACTGQTGRACTNDGNLVTVGLRLYCLFGAVFARIVGYKAL